VEGLPDPSRTPIILSSDGRDADAESLGKSQIDTGELRKEGAILKTRMEKIIQSLVKQQRRGQQEQAQNLTSVRDGVMYG